MGARNAVERAAPGLALLMMCSSLAAAAAATPQLSAEEIDLSADVMRLDPREDVHEMSGNVRIRQGDISMQADRATATDTQTDHSRWTLNRSVQIRTAEAELKSDFASATFANGEVAQAVATGTPALFEQLNVPADKQVRGRANRIEYDFGKSTVKLSGNVWFSQGGYDFRGDSLLYNVRDGEVMMDSGGKKGRVKVTLRPRNGKLKPEARTTPANPPASGGTRKPGSGA